MCLIIPGFSVYSKDLSFSLYVYAVSAISYWPICPPLEHMYCLSFHLTLHDMFSPWTWISLSHQDQLAIERQGPSCLCHHAQLFMWELGIWIRLSILASRVPYWLSHLLSPILKNGGSFDANLYCTSLSTSLCLEMKSAMGDFSYTVYSSQPSISNRMLFFQVLSTRLPHVPITGCHSSWILWGRSHISWSVHCLSLLSFHSVNIHSMLDF